jgi:hypothetical protein
MSYFDPIPLSPLPTGEGGITKREAEPLLNSPGAACLKNPKGRVPRVNPWVNETSPEGRQAKLDF